MDFASHTYVIARDKLTPASLMYHQLAHILNSLLTMPSRTFVIADSVRHPLLRMPGMLTRIYIFSTR